VAAQKRPEFILERDAAMVFLLVLPEVPGSAETAFDF
jgi:hypothetical protein